ncbi:unnamed protein product [Ilex paraguariensis]|uniref:C2H2-type domain-containing protein n=1 Tax=Ilex paraguariensis TaxID=185542 RepID=A0ABC8QMX1_9AQUA
MEAQEQVMGSKDHNQMIKGKRTKRQKPASPLTLTMASTSCSTAEGGSASDKSTGYDRVTVSPTYYREFAHRGEEEEEDMANCLILLAQGQSRKFSDPVSTEPNSPRLCVYQCKTCNRSFSSFQALGGHRASHRKAIAAAEEKKQLASLKEEHDQFNHHSTILSLQTPNRVPCSNNKTKVHECSLCGAEFTSGQALGGHMRRHRPMPVAASSADESQETKKQKNLLSLDLNLPAPEEDRRETKFPFASKGQVIVFSSSPLVDCHY